MVLNLKAQFRWLVWDYFFLFKMCINSTSVCHKPRKFELWQKSFKIPGKQNGKLKKKKKKGRGHGRVGVKSGPKATSGYTRQLNTQQNFKTCKTNWSLFSFNQPYIVFLKNFLKIFIKKKEHKNTDFFHFIAFPVCSML